MYLIQLFFYFTFKWPDPYISQKSFQYLSGPDLPYNVENSQMVTSPDGDGIILLGGDVPRQEGWGSESSAKLLQLKRDSNGWASSWTTMKQKLKYGRRQHVAIPIPNELTTCE